MSRMNQVMQVGDTSGDIQYYIEDYAYTYLKKQKGREKTKYFLYGEKEETEKTKKLYIYGIAEKPKMEQTYFKDYYPLGFLKIKNDENYWVTLKGQEEKITGFFVFYAPNQAMQEYLVDCHEEIKEDEPEKRSKRQLPPDILPVKEVMVPARKTRIRKGDKEKNALPVSFMGIVVAMILLLVLTSANGQKKLGIFKQVIKETMGSVIEELPEELPITLVATIGSETLELTTVIQEAIPKKHLVTAEPIYRNDRIISFRAKGLIVDLVTQLPDNPPIIFKNITVHLMKREDGSLCYALTTLAESKVLNRRGSFRCFLGIPSSV